MIHRPRFLKRLLTVIGIALCEVAIMFVVGPRLLLVGSLLFLAVGLGQRLAQNIRDDIGGTPFRAATRPPAQGAWNRAPSGGSP
jgi:hypothetical protein